MQITEAFKGKTLVITGGTGSFGSTVLKHFYMVPNSPISPAKRKNTVENTPIITDQPIDRFNFESVSSHITLPLLTVGHTPPI